MELREKLMPILLWLAVLLIVISLLFLVSGSTSPALESASPQGEQAESLSHTSAEEREAPTDESLEGDERAVADAPEDRPDFDMDDWALTLVNVDNPLPEDFAVELAEVADGYTFDARAADALRAMLDDGNSQGLGLYICSAYRSVEYQEGLFENRVNRWMATGMDRDEATEAAATSVNYPGTSEHNLGLAADILCNSYTSLTAGFGDTAAGIWLQENCADYGFILRYPEDKSDITGTIYEPWHFRYVGQEAAAYIMEAGICLEEFWEIFGE